MNIFLIPVCDTLFFKRFHFFCVHMKVNMPRNVHKCNVTVKDLTSLFPMLKHKKCSTRRSQLFLGSLLNDVFDVNTFDYAKDYEVCEYFMSRLRMFNSEKFCLLKASQNVPINRNISEKKLDAFYKELRSFD